MDAGNPVQSEYIIMEEAAGVQLSQVWDTLPLKTKLEIVKDLVNIEKKLLSISFTRYGSLYFAHQDFSGCVKWDTHASNLFVENGKISSIIDWQDSWAGPLFLQARQPQLVDYDGDILLRLPPHYDALEDQDEKSRIRSQVEKSILLWSYERNTKNINHLLHEVFHLPHGRTRRDVVDFSANTWDADIVPFRESLIRIQRNWDDICPGRPCPIEFTKGEIETHFRETDGWNENADFWASISSLVQRDGWTSHQTYDDAVKLFAQLRAEGLW